jgi:beta-barrel assembly-enhancing protease
MRIFSRNLLICLLFIAPMVAQGALPDLGDPSETVVSPNKMQQVGQQDMGELQAQALIVRDVFIQHYIERLGQRLLAKQRRQYSHLKIHFFVVNDPEINAFALPGGFIGVNAGLILKTQSESELAAVMSHEIAHVLLHHIRQQIARSKQMRIPMVLSGVAAIALGAVNPEVGAGALLGTMAGFQQSNINYTRANEKAADRLGIKILFDAGLNPNSMAAFFRRLKNNERLYGIENIPKILLDHPVTALRIADAQNRAADMHVKKINTHALQYRLMRARLAMTDADNLQESVMSKQQHCQQENQVACYAFAYGLMREDNWEQAKPILQSLAHHYPAQLIYSITLAEGELDHNEVKSAVRRLRILHQLYPDNYVTQLLYPKALLEDGQYNRARRLLESLTASRPKDLAVLGMLARAQAKSHAMSEAYITLAKIWQVLGRKNNMKGSLKTATRYAKHSKNKRVLLAQIKAMRQPGENRKI